MKHHYDPDLGRLCAHIDDHGGIEIHRDAISGHTMVPLGIAAVKLAIDILTLSGQADATVVQRISDTIAARAEAGDMLSVAEMRGIAATLRMGIGAPIVPVLAVRPSAEVVQFRPRAAVVVSVPVGGMVG